MKALRRITLADELVIFCFLIKYSFNFSQNCPTIDTCEQLSTFLEANELFWRDPGQRGQMV